MNKIANSKATARVSLPQRAQVQMRLHSLEELVPKDHRARLVWRYVQGLNLEPLYADILVDDRTTGRPAIAPEILVSLWLLATLDGISSAREVARRCETDIPYLWVCGEVGVNYHSISDFRTGHAEFLERVLVDSVAALIASGIVSLETVAQDGMRVRANAGKSSFRRKPTLEELQDKSRAHLEKLKEENSDEEKRHQAKTRRQAAAQRAAEERTARIADALAQRDELAARREKKQEGEGEKTRTSTTDPDARKMKMANGGFDPAFNIQFATDGDARIIAGVSVSNEGTDGGQLEPMRQQLEKDYGRTPKNMLVDSAYATKAGVTAVEKAGTKIVSTVPRSEQLKKNGKDPSARQKGDTDEYAQFRSRMSEPEYQELYKLRPSIAEFPNAVCRNCGLRQFPVRGLAKAKAVALWHAIAFNFTRMLKLGVIGN